MRSLVPTCIWLLLALQYGCGATERDASPPGDDAAIADVAVPEVHVVDASNDGDAGPLCSSEGAVTHVSGELPAGNFESQFAAFGVKGGECGGTTLLLLPQGPLSSSYESEWPTPWARVSLAEPGPGELAAMATVQTASATYDQLAAVVQLTSWDGPLQGTVSIDDQGVNLAGSFQAGHCAPLDIFCP